MKVLVTGADGFIGRNLVVRLRELAGNEVLTYVRGQDVKVLNELLLKADAVVHLAGENRPMEVKAFTEVNIGLTELLSSGLKMLDKPIPVIFASSVQANLSNPYGYSKLGAEKVLQNLENEYAFPVAIYRLPGVFGKWGKPNYNSVVATFCYNKIRNLPIEITNPNTILNLVYVDDVVNAFLRQLESEWSGLVRPGICPEYMITLGDLSDQIDAFKYSRGTLVSERVGVGLTRALYATYLSYLPISEFKYKVPSYKDGRGVFVEVLKTLDSGQFSFFTVYPGVTRGGHYHHTKTEKFIIIKGNARFSFRHILTNEVHCLETSSVIFEIVETVPGWAHEITNIGTDEMIVMLWANEIFDRNSPDTISEKV